MLILGGFIRQINDFVDCWPVFASGLYIGVPLLVLAVLGLVTVLFVYCYKQKCSKISSRDSVSKKQNNRYFSDSFTTSVIYLITNSPSVAALHTSKDPMAPVLVLLLSLQLHRTCQPVLTLFILRRTLNQGQLVMEERLLAVMRPHNQRIEQKRKNCRLLWK